MPDILEIYLFLLALKNIKNVKVSVMDNELWEKLADFQQDGDDLIQLYEEWGDSEYLKEIFASLDDYNTDWNKEKELGSWAAEFILDTLSEVEEELESMTPKERMRKFDELIDDRYEDFRSGHQFARVNNINLHIQEGEDLDAILAEEDEKITFPVLI